VHQWVESQKWKEIEASLTEKPDTIAELEWMTLARACIALDGEWVDKAVRLLNRLAEVSRATGQVALLIETQTLLALAYRARGEPLTADKLLRECLVLAQPEGYLRQFLNEGEVMRDMLEECQSRIKEPLKSEHQSLLSYISQILSAFTPRPEPQPQPEEFGAPQTALVEPISGRELEVLDLICKGYSNQEIAEKLVVTLNTVKKHNNRIFGKLGVSSRVQAVLQARKLGLVQEAFPPTEG
jgi:LuxR family maltose regulon positive regulatory protein